MSDPDLSISSNNPLFRLESYSCKMTGDDKKLLKHIATSNDEGLLALSPPTQV